MAEIVDKVRGIRGRLEEIKQGEQGKFMENIKKNSKENSQEAAKIVNEGKDILDTQRVFDKNKQQEKDKQKQGPTFTMGQ